MEVEKRTNLRSKNAVQRGQVHNSSSGKSSPRKRTYQRDNNPRRNSWQTRDQSSTLAPNDDLRSPCHKQPRFKGQKENSPGNRSTPNYRGPWNNKKINSSNEDNLKMKLTNSEFPPLGFDMDGCTPEPSKDWGSIMDEEDEKTNKQCDKQSQKALKFKRRLLLPASDSNETSKNQTEDKTKSKSKVLRPVMTDPHKLTKRQKQIDIGKNTVSYGQYIKTVPRQDRSKDDPWTPDKFQQCSTRSWVGQIKVWRRRLHRYDVSSEHKEDLFSTSSASSSQTTADVSMDVEEDTKLNTIEDMFQGFDLDSCLMDDGFPL